jgi:hypothetical protein
MMGAKIIYNWVLRPIFRCIGPAIKKFQERHADDLYQMEWDMQANLKDLKKTAMDAGTATFVEMAMEKMAED